MPVYMIPVCHFTLAILQENEMSFKTPTMQVAKTPDPLINLRETNADVQNQRNKQGMLASFLQGNNRGSGFLANALNRQSTLGNSGI